MPMGGRNGMVTKRNSPRFVLEASKLSANLAHFSALAQETGILWLYTLKAFDEAQGVDIIMETFDGYSLGNLTENDKVQGYSRKHQHTYAPAYHPSEVLPLAKQSDTMSFNSLHQWQQYRTMCESQTSLGLRINPHLKLDQPSYCDSNAGRLGVGYEAFLEALREDASAFESLEGLHFHALCHQDADALTKLLMHIRSHYQEILPRLKWLNLGGGQNFTHEGYDSQAFISEIRDFSQAYPHLTLYLEPGAAVVHETGYFETTILDIIPASPPIVIIDSSIETHLLDIAITKEKPVIRGTTTDSSSYAYEITGMSCIAGDVIGRYAFSEELSIGKKIILENMIGYTLVKQTTFNGISKAGFDLEV